MSERECAKCEWWYPVAGRCEGNGMRPEQGYTRSDVGDCLFALPTHGTMRVAKDMRCPNFGKKNNSESS